VAVDGGGSKTDVVALTLTGRLVAQARGGCSSPQIVGLAAATQTIGALIAEATAQSEGRALARVGMYLSGLDLPREITAFSAAIADETWAQGGGRTIVDNDLFALLRAGTTEPDAIAIVCGTGINCVGVRADGATVRYPALGTISGDWGGGWHLGEQALWHAARAVDGRGEPTSLTVAIPAVFGLRDIHTVIEALHFESLDQAELAALTPTIFDAASAGDTVAGLLLDRQAEEVVAFAVSSLRRLELMEHETPIVLGGGLIGAQHPRLMAGIETGLALQAPRARIKLVTAPPILGAALLVLESIGAEAAVLERATLEIRDIRRLVSRRGSLRELRLNRHPPTG
jgi:N-acetylglucosamine kinase-like BadF-type ATPase